MLAELKFYLSDILQPNRTLLNNWNQTGKPHPPDFVHSIFERAASQYPDRVAVETPGASFTYAQLNSRANQMAQRLKELVYGAGGC